MSIQQEDCLSTNQDANGYEGFMRHPNTSSVNMLIHGLEILKDCLKENMELQVFLNKPTAQVSCLVQKRSV